MKAVYIERHGGLEELRYGDLAEPEPGPGTVKVRVRAAALNRLDLFTRIGIRGAALRDDQFPMILGGDCAGEVAGIGDGVDGFQLGQRVVVDPLVSCGACIHCEEGDPSKCAERLVLGTHTQGSYAEYVVVPASNAFVISERLSYEEAAALPTVFLPTWSIIMREAQLQHEETALVLSASSGIGTAAVQLIKNVVGATCIATTSTGAKAQAVMELGADHVINYNREDVARRVMQLTRGRGVDLVVDSVGSQFFEAAYSCLATGGRYGVCGVTTGYAANIQLGQLFSKEQHLFGVYMGSLRDMRRILDAASRGTIRSVISATFPLENARDAHELMESNKHIGKIVLTVP